MKAGKTYPPVGEAHHPFNASMEPGNEGREDAGVEMVQYILMTASMEPGHEGREDPRPGG